MASCRPCEPVKPGTRLHVLVLYALLYTAKVTTGVLLGAAILPHGSIIIEPRNFQTNSTEDRALAQKLHSACVDIGRQVAQLQPDVLFMTTPHGLADSQQFMLYQNPLGQGSVDLDAVTCAYPPCKYHLSASFEANLTDTLLSHLRSTGLSVSGLSAFGPPGESSEPMPLRWAEVIPLHFLQAPSTASPTPKVIILSMPSRRYTHSPGMIPELLRLGKETFRALSTIPQRVVWVVSGDLAHTHSADGPYGYSKHAQLFDDALYNWVTQANQSQLLVEAAEHVEQALSCGYTGMVMLQGALQQLQPTGVRGSVLAFGHPSYYGMMAALFANFSRVEGGARLDSKL